MIVQLYLISSQPVTVIFAGMKAIFFGIFSWLHIVRHFRGFDPIVFDARPQKKIFLSPSVQSFVYP